MRLTSPLGTTVNLINASTYTNEQTSLAQLRDINFSDAAGSNVGGSVLLSGTFRPVSPLSAFDTEDPSGLWTLFFQDTVALDPLSLNSWSLSVNTDGLVGQAPIPEPATVALLGIGLAGLAGAEVRRRRKNKAIDNS